LSDWWQRRAEACVGLVSCISCVSDEVACARPHKAGTTAHASQPHACTSITAASVPGGEPVQALRSKLRLAATCHSGGAHNKPPPSWCLPGRRRPQCSRPARRAGWPGCGCSARRSRCARCRASALQSAALRPARRLTRAAPSSAASRCTSLRACREHHRVSSAHVPEAQGVHERGFGAACVLTPGAGLLLF